MHTLLYTIKLKNSMCADMHSGLQILFLDIPFSYNKWVYYILTTKLFIATVSPLF